MQRLRPYDPKPQDIIHDYLNKTLDGKIPM
jgi:hypothetical protein